MLDRIALVLVIIGALNWGSIGIFNFDIVGALFGGQGSVISRIIFTIVGIAGLWAIGLLFSSISTAFIRVEPNSMPRMALPCMMVSFAVILIMCVFNDIRGSRL